MDDIWRTEQIVKETAHHKLYLEIIGVHVIEHWE